MEIARPIEVETNRAEALIAITPHLTEYPELLPQLLEIARSFENATHFAETLAAVAPHLVMHPAQLEPILEAMHGYPESHLSKILMALASTLSEHPHLLTRALETAYDIKSEALRAEVLTTLAPHLPPEQGRVVLAEVMETLSSIRFEPPRVQLLTSLAPHLARYSDLQAKALDIAYILASSSGRSAALTALAPHLPPEQERVVLADVMEILASMRSEQQRIDGLAALIPYLAEQADLLSKAWDLARSIEENLAAHAKILISLAPLLTPDQQPSILTQAFDAACSMKSEVQRTETLVALVPHLGRYGHLLDSAQNVALQIIDTRARVRVITALLPLLSTQRQANLVARTVNDTRVIANANDRIEIFTTLAPFLVKHPGLVAQIQNNPQSPESEVQRVKILAALVPQLPSEEKANALQEALDVASGIADAGIRVKALAAVVPHLPTEERSDLPPRPIVLAKIWDTTHTIRDDDDYGQALSELAGLIQYAPQEERFPILSQVVNALPGLKSELSRVAVLSAWAPHLAEHPGLLNEALDVAQSVTYEYARTEALTAIIPNLAPERRDSVLIQACDAACMAFEPSRATVLADLVPQLSLEQRPSIVTEALEAIDSIGARYIRVRTAATLLPYLKPVQQRSILTDALEASRLIRDENEHAKALAALAPHVREALELWPRILDDACGLQNEDARAKALAALAHHLPDEKGLLTQALEVTCALPGASASETKPRVEALAALAPRIAAHTNLLIQARDAAYTIQDVDARAQALTAFVPLVPPDQRHSILNHVLNTTHSIEDTGTRVQVVIELVPYLADHTDLLRKVFGEIPSVPDIDARAEILIALVSHLTEAPDLLNQVLDAARSIERGSARAKVLAALAPHLPLKQQPSVLDQALDAAPSVDAARSVTRAHDRAEILAALVPHLTGHRDLLEKIVIDVHSMIKSAHVTHGHSTSDVDYAGANCLVALGPHLTEYPGLLSQTIDVVQSLNISARTWALRKLASYLPVHTDLLTRYLSIASSLPDSLPTPTETSTEKPRADVLSALAPHLAGRSDLLDQALEIAHAIPDVAARASALSSLVPYLPPDRQAVELSEILVSTDSLNEYSWSQILSSLAPHLVDHPQLWWQAWEDADKIWDSDARATLLARLASAGVPPLTPSEQYDKLLQVWSSLSETQNRDTRMRILTLLKPQLETNRELLTPILAEVLSIADASARTQMLVALIPSLAGHANLLNQVLNTIRGTEDSNARSEILVTLAPHLDGHPELLNRALEISNDIQEVSARARTLIVLCNYVSSDLRDRQLSEALQTACSIQSESHRTLALASLDSMLAELPVPDQYANWQRSLYTLASRPRRDLLGDLQALRPTVYSLGGVSVSAETAQFIIRVGNWWP